VAIVCHIPIGVVLFPLTLKQTRSMKAMQEIQRNQADQREFKTDKPPSSRRDVWLSGGQSRCRLPLLLQMPVWFALQRLGHQLRLGGALEGAGDRLRAHLLG
jgi:hypothetical protein